MDYRVRILKQEFTRRGLKQGDLAVALDVSRQLVSSWFAEPPRNKITNAHWKKLSDIWDTDLFELEKQLEAGEAPRRPGVAGGLRAELPIINAAPGGHSIDYEEPYAIPEDWLAMRDVYETFPRPYNSSHPQAFCVRCVGDSMKPTVGEGDVVVCEPLADEDDTQERHLTGRMVFVRYGHGASEGEDQDVPTDFAGKCCLARWGGGNNEYVTLTKDNLKYKPRKVRRTWIIRLAVCVYRGQKL